jgi:hypothetical protein
MTPSVTDLKAFVPAKDFALAKQFYVDIGFTLLWAGDDVAEFQIGQFASCSRTSTSSSEPRTS